VSSWGGTAKGYSCGCSGYCGGSGCGGSGCGDSGSCGVSVSIMSSSPRGWRLATRDCAT
jgi:hypothetical protein